MFPEVRQDIHVIEVAVDGVQVLHKDEDINFSKLVKLYQIRRQEKQMGRLLFFHTTNKGHPAMNVASISALCKNKKKCIFYYIVFWNKCIFT